MKVSIELQPMLKNRTGIGWYTYQIAKRLPNKGIDISGNIFNFIGRNNITDSVKDIHMPLHCFKLFPYRWYLKVWNNIPIPYHWFFRQKVDITHFMGFIIPPNVRGKTIVMIYDMVTEIYPETMETRNRERIQSELIRSAQYADYIITISESAKKEIMQYLEVPESKIGVIYPGVEYEKFNQPCGQNKLAEIKNKYNLPEEYILYFGTLEPRKNIETIIDAFSTYKNKYNTDIKLVIAGGKGWRYESIFTQMQRLNIEQEVIFTGYVEEEDKTGIYQMASLFLFPSLYEGFGMPVIEAMAAGVPVITSNTSSLPEAAGDAAILVSPPDSAKIAKHIQEILNDDELRQSMIQKGLEQSKKFNWDTSVDKLCDIYRQVYRQNKRSI